MVPLVQVGQVDLSCMVHMAAHPNLHVLRGTNEDKRSMVRVRVQHPDRNRYVVVGTPATGARRTFLNANA